MGCLCSSREDDYYPDINSSPTSTTLSDGTGVGGANGSNYSLKTDLEMYRSSSSSTGTVGGMTATTYIPGAATFNTLDPGNLYTAHRVSGGGSQDIRTVRSNAANLVVSEYPAQFYR